jgi:hypothetical protein
VYNIKHFIVLIFYLRLHPNNVIGIRAFADQFICSNLVDESNKYIQKRFTDVCKTDEFMALDFEDVSQTLDRDELYVNSEEEVYMDTGLVVLITWGLFSSTL